MTSRDKKTLRDIRTMLLPGTDSRANVYLRVFGEELTMYVPDDDLVKIVDILEGNGDGRNRIQASEENGDD